MFYNTLINLIIRIGFCYFADMITNPFILIEGIDPKVKAELIWLEKRIEFLNNIKIEHHEKIRP